MRIMALADTPDKMLWDYLDKRLLEGVELILSCGDLPAEYLSFLTCFTHAPVLYVHGNHDVRYQTAPPEGCICIEDQVYDAGGVRILPLDPPQIVEIGAATLPDLSPAARTFLDFLEPHLVEFLSEKS